MRKLLAALALFGILLIPTKNWSQGEKETPSQKTKAAVEKLTKAPQAVRKRLEELKKAAKAKLDAALGNKKSGRVETGSFTFPTAKLAAPEGPRYSSAGKRDPFRPLGLGKSVAKIPPQCREGNLSPLQEVTISQLKLVGIIWNIGEPRAMVEDTAGLGYVIKLGTPIGECQNEGKVKAIRPREVVIEEKYRDPIFGTSKTREVVMKLHIE
ncbi:MAG: pilus assembly protein PilP [Candidatus Binatia bacterium]